MSKIPGIVEPPEEILERIKPMTVVESAAVFVNELSVAGPPERIVAVMDAHYHLDISLEPGVRKHLEHLRYAGVTIVWSPPPRRT